jgi:uncharacterized protein
MPGRQHRTVGKHGVSFEEARTVFLDDDALLAPDGEHSDEEDRFVLLGVSSNLRLLIVCHCYRRNDEVIRIISARRANSMERGQFSTAARNPYAKRLKKQLTIRIDAETIDYFQTLSREMSLPYQTLINMYLRDCATTNRRPQWAPARPAKRANRALQRTATSGGRR